MAGLVGARPRTAARRDDHERRRRLPSARSPTPAPPGSCRGSPASTSCWPTRSEAALLAGLPQPPTTATSRPPRRRRGSGRGLTTTGARAAVVKLGAHGALALTAGGQTAWADAVPVDVVDTTGAGDAFAAGFPPRLGRRRGPGHGAAAREPGRRPGREPRRRPSVATSSPPVGDPVPTRGREGHQVRSAGGPRWQSGPMSAFARVVAALIGLAVVACAFLPWVGRLHPSPSCTSGRCSGSASRRGHARHVAGHRRHRVRPADPARGDPQRADGDHRRRAARRRRCPRSGSSATPSRLAGAVPIARVQIGAFATAVCGFFALILAAVARDATTPHAARVPLTAAPTRPPTDKRPPRMARRTTTPPPSQPEKIVDIDVSEECAARSSSTPTRSSTPRAARRPRRPQAGAPPHPVPDGRDGPAPDRGHVKSARVVGEVMGKLHLTATARSTTPSCAWRRTFSLRLPLVDGHGNFGSLDGSPPAMRYTECRLAPSAQLLTASLDEDVVDFGQLRRPRDRADVLPAAFPNLLVNGASGIAVGMATNIPPHNLVEVVAAARHLLTHPRPTSDDLMRFVPGPDLPGGGRIIRLEACARPTRPVAARSASARPPTSRTSRRAARASSSPSCPTSVGPEKVIAKIKRGGRRQEAAASRRSTTSPTWSRACAWSSRSERLPPRGDPRAALPAHADGGLVQHQRRRARRRPAAHLGLREMLEVRRPPPRRRTPSLGVPPPQGRGAAAPRRGSAHRDPRHRRGHRPHPLERHAAAAKTRLIQVFDLSDVQATYILDMPLRRFTKFSRIELESERDELVARIAEPTAILDDDKQLRKVVGDETRGGGQGPRHAAPHRAPRGLGGPVRAAVPSRSATTRASCSRRAPACSRARPTTRTCRRRRARCPRRRVGVRGTAAARSDSSPAPVASLRLPVPRAAHAAADPRRPVARRRRTARCPRRRAGEGRAARRPVLASPTAVLASRSARRRRRQARGARHPELGGLVVGRAPRRRRPRRRRSGLVTGDEELVFVTTDAQLLHFPASAVRPQGLRPAAWRACVSPTVRTWCSSAPSTPGRENVVVTARGHQRRPAGHLGRDREGHAVRRARGKGRATGGVRAQRFLRGEDTLLVAWVGQRRPARRRRRAPAPLPPIDPRRDGGGLPNLEAGRRGRRPARRRRSRPGCPVDEEGTAARDRALLGGVGRRAARRNRAPRPGLAGPRAARPLRLPRCRSRTSREGPQRSRRWCPRSPARRCCSPVPSDATPTRATTTARDGSGSPRGARRRPHAVRRPPDTELLRPTSSTSSTRRRAASCRPGHGVARAAAARLHQPRRDVCCALERTAGRAGAGIRPGLRRIRPRGEPPRRPPVRTDRPAAALGRRVRSASTQAAREVLDAVRGRPRRALVTA